MSLMKKLNLILIRGFLASIFILFFSLIFADEIISGNKIKVIDGDTIELSGKKIRFSGIDAPESFFNGKKQICEKDKKKISCGEISKKKLQEKLKEKTIYCQLEQSPDRYGRYLAECFLDSESISEFMVKNGYAFDYPRYSKKKFANAQLFAKQNKLGIWSMKFEYPWEWRKKNR